MRYLVTGGAGFIGSHLCDALVAEGNQVTVLDNLSTGRQENIELLRAEARLVHGSVLDELLVDEAVRESDVVVHLAAAVGVRLIVERPLHSFLTNVRGAEVVLEAAHRYRRKVLVASSSEVYGKNGGPFREDDDRVLGSNAVSRWSYATSKAVDEILALAYHRERGLPAVVVRLFNCVGPRQSSAYGMVLPNLVEQALAGRPLTVHGDGLQTRCFCHVRDVVNALLRLIHDPRAEGEVFNVGSTEEVSILELARRVVSATGSGSPVRLVPYEEAYGEGYEDMRRRIPDISRVRALTGWEPRMSLDEIISEVIVAADPSREIGRPLAPVGERR
jgi:UDP-glucose 4-epimerase